MPASFFFYDLETSGIHPRQDRIMQFAGQRTDLDFKPIGEPVNVLIRLTPDVIPDPDAIMITGITPQSTLQDGLTETEFLQLFYAEVVTPETIYLGFNTVRFDDEFMRFLHYRNFYDAYEWQWCDDCSRWDLLDVVRMTRALRPDGIEWPYTAEGRPTNRLELLTKLNGLDHKQAHDALSDVTATIAVARLLKSKQPDIFDYLLGLRRKKDVQDRVLKGEPFVYTSGRYPSHNLHTTAAVLLAKHPEQSCAFVYDLRHDPTQFIGKSVDELAALEVARYAATKPGATRAAGLPVKVLRYNKCPAIAPLGVIKDAASETRIGLPLATILQHYELLKAHPDVVAHLIAVFARSSDRQPEVCTDQTVDGQLYGTLFTKDDSNLMRQVRQAQPHELSSIQPRLHEARLKKLLPLYKARNFPRTLSDEERAFYEDFCRRQLLDGGQESRLANYFKRLETLSAQAALTENQRYLVEELRLYGESLLPVED